MNAPTERNAQRGVSRFTVIILASIGAIILLGLLGIYLFTPRLDIVRKRANESEARLDVQILGTGQADYSFTFGDGGYARDLASLGPDTYISGKCVQGRTPAHACMISADLGNSTCTGTSWCARGGYKFNVQGICANGKCADYVISATPTDVLSGSKNFCSTSDNTVHSETAAPRSAPFSLKECQTLPAM